jgi:hypothetical protein
MPAPARFDNLAGDAIRLGELKAERRAFMKRAVGFILYSVLIVVLGAGLSCVVLDMFYGISMSAFFSTSGILTLQTVLGISSSAVSISLPSASTLSIEPSSQGGIVLSTSSGLGINSDVTIGDSSATYDFDVSGNGNINGDLLVAGTLHPTHMNLTYSTIYIGNSTSKTRYIKPLNFSFARLIVSDLEFDSSYLNIVDSADVAGVHIDDTSVFVPQTLSVSGLITASSGMQSSSTISIFSGGQLCT